MKKPFDAHFKSLAAAKKVIAKTKNQLVIDNMSPLATPLYDCAIGSEPLVCKIQTKRDGSVESRMIKVKKDGPTRYYVPLYKINGNTLLGIANILRGMENDKCDMSDVTLCIRGDEIGLTKHGKLICFSTGETCKCGHGLKKRT
jgi:hypothetical protein